MGAAPEALSDARSYGVLGMRERAGHFGGRLGIEWAGGAGTAEALCASVRMSGPAEFVFEGETEL